MKIEETQQTNVFVTEVQGMDKFSFVLSTINGNGSILIDTTSGAFTYTFGSMGTDTIEEFIPLTNDDYLSRCFLRGILDEDERSQKYYALSKALKCIRQYIEGKHNELQSN